MLHTLSKLTSFVWDPGSWIIAFALFAALMLRSHIDSRKRWGRRSAVFALLLFVFFSWTAPANYLIARLERQHSSPASLEGFEGMLILGGAFASRRTQETYLPPLACAAERVVEPVALLATHPKLRAVFLGGDARLTNEPAPEADFAKHHFERLGVDLSRVRFESLSRNTYEN
ncbi:MAG: YdcF family protein, partial [Casimicrobium sp.]